MNKGTYRLKPGNEHYEGGKVLKAGDELEMDDDRAAGLLDRFELVWQKRPVDTSQQPQQSQLPQTFGFLEGTVADAVAEIANLTTVAQVDAVAKAEEDGKNRKGVLDSLDAKRAELKG